LDNKSRIQITLGGWTSANYAAIICADFPVCQGHRIPPLDIAGAFQISQEGVQSYLGGFMGNDARVKVYWLLLVLVVQVTLGISNVVFSLPLSVAVAHNGVAALLLLTMVSGMHTLGQQKYRS